ncbi:MAG: hypothetical protein J0M20_18210, partial [Burkholderiales bacterium]|nr:hypothetical protein [Burkholderiales bacterium]
MLIALLGALIHDPARAADPPVPIERFFERPAIVDLRLSPSGRQLAFTTSAKRQRVGLAVMDLTGSMAGRWVAGFPNVDIDGFQWVNDKQLIFDAYDYQAASGDVHDAPGLHLIKADGSDHLRLPLNLSLLAVVPSHEDEVIVGYWTAGRMTPVWMSTDSGLLRDLDLRAPPSNVERWWFDPQGVPRAVMSKQGKQVSVHWRGASDDGWRQLAEATPEELSFVPKAVDAKGVLYLTQRHGAGRWRALSRYAFALFAASLEQALVCRFCVGLALAGIYPLGMKLVVGWAPERS